MCCAGAVHTDAGCVVNMCCCFSAGAVHTDAACVVASVLVPCIQMLRVLLTCAVAFAPALLSIFAIEKKNF